MVAGVDAFLLPALAIAFVSPSEIPYALCTNIVVAGTVSISQFVSWGRVHVILVQWFNLMGYDDWLGRVETTTSTCNFINLICNRNIS